MMKEGIPLSLSCSIAIISLSDSPDALQRIVAVPLSESPSSWDVRMTVWYEFQFDVVKVRFRPAEIYISVSPLIHDEFTVIFEPGCAESLTPNEVVDPSGTPTEFVFVTICNISLSCSTAVMSLLDSPEALHRIAAVPLAVSLSSWAVKVTVWYEFQFEGVKVRLVPAET